MPGPLIPAHRYWMEKTKLGSLQRRSGEIQVVDEAILNYHRQTTPKEKRVAVAAIRIALNEWIRMKGRNWKKSARNKPPVFIITELYNEVNKQEDWTDEEKAAFRFQDEKRRERIQTIFKGKKVVFQAFSTAGAARAALTQVQRARISGMSSTGTAHTHDSSALGKRIKEQEEMRRIREIHRGGATRAGATHTATGAGNTAADIAYPTASLAQNGIGQTGRERSFGLAGTQMTHGHASTLASNAGPAWSGVASAASSTFSGAFNDMISNFGGGIVGLGEASAHLVETVGADVATIASDCLPIISNITSGIKLLVAWGKAGYAMYQADAMADHGHYIAHGDILAAFRGLQEMLDRSLASELTQATIQTADFATRTAMTFADGGLISGTAVGAATTVAKLVHKLFLLIRELAETKKAQTLIDDPANLDFKLFKTNPLMGCYMLCCSDLSELMLISRTETISRGIPFGGVGWMDDVEFMKREHIDPIITKATEYIYKAKFSIKDMPVHALYQPGALDKAKYYAEQKLLQAQIVRGIGMTLEAVV